MTKNHTRATPLISRQKSAEQIVRLLDESRAATHMNTYEHFRRTLGIWQVALMRAKTRPWLEACAGMEKGMEPLTRALGLLMAEAAYGYEDILGLVYMLLSQGEKRLGQYFTPYPIARMMAEMNLGNFKPPKPEDPPIKILEPSCGSGVMILAAASVVETHSPGSILRGEVLFYGVDIDALCVQMCQINMLLHRIGHLVRLPDSGQDQGHANKSPRYGFCPAKIVWGDALTQEAKDLFAQEAPYIPVNLLFASERTDEKFPQRRKEEVVGEQDKTEEQVLLETATPSFKEDGGEQSVQMETIEQENGVLFASEERQCDWEEHSRQHSSLMHRRHHKRQRKDTAHVFQQDLFSPFS